MLRIVLGVLPSRSSLPISRITSAGSIVSTGRSLKKGSKWTRT
jgi:hypothetical protein